MHGAQGSISLQTRVYMAPMFRGVLLWKSILFGLGYGLQRPVLEIREVC